MVSKCRGNVSFPDTRWTLNQNIPSDVDFSTIRRIFGENVVFAVVTAVGRKEPYRETRWQEIGSGWRLASSEPDTRTPQALRVLMASGSATSQFIDVSAVSEYHEIR